ncbi:MAG TPA: patatin family protein [Firmicutes bacterium]|nr:patatin family protein [Bacillota bacterium]
MKTAVVDVGGGLRGIYATGVLDRCLEEGIRFDAGVGVSAGSANISSYLAGQKGRNYQFYTEYSGRKEYMSLRNFLFKKSYIDMDYVYGVLSNDDGENPLDYEALAANPAPFIAVATNAETGQAQYFDKKDIAQNNYDVIKASCSIPFVCHPYLIGGVPYYDGALSDPVPIEKAFSMGCDRVVLILTKPRDFVRTPDKDRKLAAGIRKKYPLAAAQLEQRAARYNDGVALAKRYEEQGRLLIVAPDDTCGMDTLTRNPEAMKRFYEKGLQDGGNIVPFVA